MRPDSGWQRPTVSGGVALHLRQVDALQEKRDLVHALVELHVVRGRVALANVAVQLAELRHQGGDAVVRVRLRWQARAPLRTHVRAHPQSLAGLIVKSFWWVQVRGSRAGGEMYSAVS